MEVIRMRSPSIALAVLAILPFGGCGDGSLPAAADGVGGSLSSGGVVGTGGATPAGAGGADAALSTGGTVGTGGAMLAEAGAADGQIPTGGAVGMGGTTSAETLEAGVALSTGGALGTGAVISAGAGGTDGPLSTGGAVGAGGARSTGGVVGAVDASEGDTVADSPGEAGGGSSGKNILDLVPLDNAVSGWAVDREHNRNGNPQPMTATTQQDTEALIDGAAADFFMPPYTPKEFAWQNYVNTTLPIAPDGARLSLYILWMPSAEQATGLYAALLQASLYSTRVGTPDDWQPTTPPVGTESRIQDTGSSWWINFHQDAFYVEIALDPSYGPAPDYVPGSAETKAEALRFALAVASKI
jgi:hypothetical protein